MNECSNVAAKLVRRFSLHPATTTLLALLLTALALASVRAASGDLDPSFDQNGTTSTSFGPGNGALGAAMVVQPDGRIIVAGRYAGPEEDAKDRFALARFERNGARDSSFGLDGLVLSTITGGYTNSLGSQILAIAIQTDAKIIAVGRGAAAREGGVDFFTAIARYDSDGSLDSSFGPGTSLSKTLLIGTGASAVAVQTDGKIVIGSEFGFQVRRLLPNGDIDASFGISGVVSSSFESADALAALTLQTDGKIVAAGCSRCLTGQGATFALARYTTDGAPDTTFGSSGTLTTRIPGNFWSIARAVKIQPDGRIVVGGTGFYSFATVRYLSDGTLDPSYGLTGTSTITTVPGPTGFAGHYGFGLALQQDGKIVIGGRRDSGNPNFPTSRYSALGRFNYDGSVDTSFGNQGIVISDFGDRNSEGKALALQTDGRILLAGWGCTDPAVPTGNCLFVSRYENTVGPSPPTQQYIASNVLLRYPAPAN